jgi:hypothetical protein
VPACLHERIPRLTVVNQVSLPATGTGIVTQQYLKLLCLLAGPDERGVFCQSANGFGEWRQTEDLLACS